ncbi:Tau-tubulin kinase 1 [Araneus ventricosus]|uniref:Tau-tubulin kinase 1 n=1 Tax=Araneus ventricosus TaxID=182803 RepID=A0A4Y2NAC3_ARAVE|nr:Tau-tubulin kinase 1 [Araneus ventricosus]
MAEGMLPRNSIVCDRWQIEEKIGKGGFGEVYRCKDSRTNKCVALKLVSKSNVNPGIHHLNNEAKALRAVQGKKFFARYYSYRRILLFDFLVMELLGPNLRGLKKTYPDKRITVDATLSMGRMMLKSVEWLHDAGYLHRDIKPKAYFWYFGMKLGDQDKYWVPHFTCRSCVEKLRNWTLGKSLCLPFGIPMVWREPQNHVDDCYFCLCKIAGYNKRSKSNIVYPNLKSAIRPIAHCENIPVPTRPEAFDSANISESESDEKDLDFTVKNEVPEKFNQAELNDLVRDLGLTKENAELLGSRLKEKNLLTTHTSFSWYRNREKQFLSFFKSDNFLVYCADIPGLLHELEDIPYNPNNWRLFIDSSKRSLKAFLLHNESKLASVPVAHSVFMKETYESMEMLLTKIKYTEHKWAICGDLKGIGLLLGQQSGFTKFPCFICEWDSRDRESHWIKKIWPKRQEWIPGRRIF